MEQAEIGRPRTRPAGRQEGPVSCCAGATLRLMNAFRARLQPWLVVFLAAASVWFVWRAWSPSMSADTRTSMRYEATDLAARFAANEAAGHASIVGQVVEVHGRVHVVIVSAGRPRLSIGVLFRNVDCVLPKSSMADAGRLRHGEPVRVKGRVEATGRHVVLRPRVLV